MTLHQHNKKKHTKCMTQKQQQFNKYSISNRISKSLDLSLTRNVYAGTNQIKTKEQKHFKETQKQWKLKTCIKLILV